MSKQTSPENSGIIPRAIKHIFEEINRRKIAEQEESKTFQPETNEIKVSLQEIYMDSVRDLLNPSNVMT